jgi:DNA-binding XRE family transcriptional regulator
MRKNIKIPRILKINRIDGLTISVVFNNGESRKIDFKSLLRKIGIDEKSPAAILFNEEELKKAELENNTLSWNNVEQYITLKNNEKLKVPFEIGADVLFKNSEPEKNDGVLQIGRIIRESRIRSGLTQKELAKKSGTSRTYISRIENDRSDIEIATLRKIVEAGLGKKLDVRIK